MLQLISWFLFGLSGCAYWYYIWKRQRDIEQLRLELSAHTAHLEDVRRNVDYLYEYLFAETKEPADTREPDTPQMNLDAKRKIGKGETEWKN